VIGGKVPTTSREILVGGMVDPKAWRSSGRRSEGGGGRRRDGGAGVDGEE
jgi:hypothetical protein